MGAGEGELISPYFKIFIYIFQLQWKTFFCLPPGYPKIMGNLLRSPPLPTLESWGKIPPESATEYLASTGIMTNFFKNCNSALNSLLIIYVTLS